MENSTGRGLWVLSAKGSMESGKGGSLKGERSDQWRKREEQEGAG
jgi:hypothetical protein